MVTNVKTHDELKTIFGRNLKKFRTRAKMSQTVLGESLELNQSSVSMIETGVNAMTFPDLVEAARLIGISPISLCTTEEYTTEQVDMILAFHKVLSFGPKNEYYAILKTVLKDALKK